MPPTPCAPSPTSSSASDTSSVASSDYMYPDDPDLAPDVLGIYTGPEADAVLSRSHAFWMGAVKAALAAPRGEFPASTFHLEGLLQCIPALPSVIPPDFIFLEGYSTWENSDTSCSLRTKTEDAHRLVLRVPRPYTISVSSSDIFQIWQGTENNRVAFLILGWAYVLNATIAESQGLPLEMVPSPSAPGSSSIPPHPEGNPQISTSFDLSYAQPEEVSWWKHLLAPRLSFSVDCEMFLPFSLDVTNLASVKLVGVDPPGNPPPKTTSSFELPSASQAAEYLQNFSFAYNLGHQTSAALAAVLCFRVQRATHKLTVPNPTLSTPRTMRATRAGKKARECYGRVPQEFDQLRHYIVIGLSVHLLPVVLESLLWQSDVPCNHAGHWLRPMRRFLHSVIVSGNRECLARSIAYSSARSSPLWLGVLLCGEYPYLLKALDYYVFSWRWTLDFGAWTSLPRSFLALQPLGPHLRNGSVSRSDVWRLRRDLRHRYEEDDYRPEPGGPYFPFGSMQPEDIELELHDHLHCSHQWAYKHWTWKHNSDIDAGFKTTGDDFFDYSEQLASRQGVSHSQHARFYHCREDVKAIRRISRSATEGAFRWCASQVEKGFTEHVVPRRRFSVGIPLSEGSTGSESSEDGVSRIRAWLSGVGLGPLQDETGTKG